MTSHSLSRAIRVAALMTILSVETAAIAYAEAPGEDEGLNAVLMATEKRNLVRQANSGSSLVTVAPATTTTTASAPTGADPATKPGS